MFPVPQKKYKVIVSVITYNHRDYIEDTLKGMIIQQTNFDFVVLVLDDHSSDGTTEIVQQYESKYPELIKGFYFEENQFSKGSYTMLQLQSWVPYTEYFATSEGDDYWIDPLKLQKQADFMDSHPQCTLSFHGVMEHWQDGSAPDKIFYPIEDRPYAAVEVFKQWIVSTTSVMARSEVFLSPQLLDLVHNKGLMYNDQAIFMFCAILGEIWGMSDVMGVYRRLKSGYSMRLEKDLKRSYQMIDRYCTHCQTMAEIFGKNLGTEFVRESDSRFVDTAVNGSLLALTNRDFKQAKYFFIRSFRRHAKDTLRILGCRILKYIKDKN